jgi:hypothetical protein
MADSKLNCLAVLAHIGNEFWFFTRRFAGALTDGEPGMRLDT